jgi:adenine-specific DNA-methyltransferase
VFALSILLHKGYVLQMPRKKRNEKEHASFEVPTVSLQVHQRIDPHTIIEAVRKRNLIASPVQASLFERRGENPPFQEAIDF